MAKPEPMFGREAEPVADLCFTEVAADPMRLPALRAAFVEWAQRTGLSPEQIEAAGLASYEALANVVAHAYQGEGVLDMHATRTGSAVAVTVIDHGRWRPPAAGGQHAEVPKPGHMELGGRGLVLIRNLADQAEVTTGEAGTEVRMRWFVE